MDEVVGFGVIGHGEWTGRVDAEGVGGGVEDEGFHGGRMLWYGSCCSHGSFMDVLPESRSELSED